MRIHKSGDKSVAFFIAYMKLLVLSEKTSIETLEQYMLVHFFQDDIDSFGSITHENFKTALLQLTMDP
ncbi:MAG: hypothetical protein UHX00_08805 [Caryophanon sp.]|nr:hypothetical protein [Caryophanon sp.]